MRGADDDPTLRAAVPQSTCTKPGDSSIPVAVSVAVGRGTRGHAGARGTDESRAIPRTARVLLALPNGFPSWTSPVRPRSPALSRSSSPLVAGATAGSQGLTTPGWAQRPRRVATLPEPPFRAWAPSPPNCNPDPATRCCASCRRQASRGAEVLVLAREHEERRAGRADGEVSEEVEPVRAGVDRLGRHAPGCSVGGLRDPDRRHQRSGPGSSPGQLHGAFSAPLTAEGSLGSKPDPPGPTTAMEAQGTIRCPSCGNANRPY